MKAQKSRAGRKAAGPITGKSSTFSTRITDETRGAIEAEATASGQSISQAAERLIRLGLQVRREREFDDPMRALGYVMEGLATICRSSAENGRLCHWHNDPSVFEAFRLALVKLLDHIKPPGAIDSSLEGPLVGQPPEICGERAFRQIWSVLLHARPHTPDDVKTLFERGGRSRTMPEDALAAMSRSSYALADAKRALKINLSDEEKVK